MIPTRVDCGVVQGSTLGQKLFLTYINMISKLSIKCKLFLFAEDYLIFIQTDRWHNVRIKALIEISFICHNFCIGMPSKSETCIARLCDNQH